MLQAEQIAFLDDVQKAAVARMEAFFASDGWQFLQQYIDSNIELATQRALSAPNWDAHLIARVQRLEFERWKNLEALFEAEYASLAQQALEAKQPDLVDLEDEDWYE